MQVIENGFLALLTVTIISGFCGAVFRGAVRIDKEKYGTDNWNLIIPAAVFNLIFIPAAALSFLSALLNLTRYIKGM